MIMLAFLVAVSSLAPLEDPSPAWYDDVLVWDMQYDASWYGVGQEYLAGVCNSNGRLYACAVTDSSLSKSAVLASANGGATWYTGHLNTSETSAFYDPQLCIYTQSPYEYLFEFVVDRLPGTRGRVLSLQFLLPGISLYGFSIIEMNHPAADTIRSISACATEDTDDLWVCADDQAGNLFISGADTPGAWTAWEQLLTGVERPSLCCGPGGWLHIAFQDHATSQIRCLSMSPTDTTLVALGGGQPYAGPVAACEWTGSQMVGVVWHDAAGQVRFSTSADHGASWSAPAVLGLGTYPFLDVNRATGNAVYSYLDGTNGLARVASAASLAQLVSAIPYIRSETVPCPSTHAVVRQGPSSTNQALFFLAEGPSDLWFDSSVLTGIEEGDGAGGLLIRPVSNPSPAGFAIEFATGSAGPVTVELRSIDGRLVETVYQGVSSSGTVQAGAGLPAGVYVAVLRSGGSEESVRLVKF